MTSWNLCSLLSLGTASESRVPWGNEGRKSISGLSRGCFGSNICTTKSRSGCPDDDPGSKEWHKWAVDFCVLTFCHMETRNIHLAGWQQARKFPKKHSIRWATITLCSFISKQSNKDQQHWYPRILLPWLSMRVGFFIVLMVLLWTQEEVWVLRHHFKNLYGQYKNLGLCGSSNSHSSPVAFLQPAFSPLLLPFPSPSCPQLTVLV